MRIPQMDSTSSPTTFGRTLKVPTIVALAMLAVLPGCVRRRLMVRSNPPGATVYVDNQAVGTTPCATSFTYYGTREIRLVKPGYETLTINQPIPAPWYQIPPIDFVSETVVPNEIQDYRTVTYTMTPQVVHPTEQIIARAEQLRSGTLQGAVLPTGAAVPFAPVAPTLSPPTIESQGLNPGGVLTQPLPPASGAENVPQGVIVPPTSGSGFLPPGGRTLEPLPAP
jgi:hypothetical protein